MSRMAMSAAAATLIATSACVEDREAALAARVAELSEACRVADVVALDGMIAARYSHINNGGKPIDRDGESANSDIRFTDPWVLEYGVWKRAAFHDSPAR